MVVERHRCYTELVLQGELDVVGAEAMRRDAERALAGTAGPVVVDLAEVTMVDIPSLRGLLHIGDRCAARGRPFVLRRPSVLVRHLLDWSGLGASVCAIDDSPETSAHAASVSTSVLTG
jgi:anti-anti-sigma factor